MNNQTINISGVLISRVSTSKESSNIVQEKEKKLRYKMVREIKCSDLMARCSN